MGDKSENPTTIRDATKRFDAFLVLSQTDPVAAESALVRAGTLANDASFIVAKYARSVRRLNIEVRHEYERRRLVLAQSLEAELLDAKDSIFLPTPVENQPSTLFAVVGNTGPVTINAPQTIAGAGATIDIGMIVSGGVAYSDEDREILKLIESLDDKVEALRLRSELDRLKDVGLGQRSAELLCRSSNPSCIQARSSSSERLTTLARKYW